MRYLPACRQQNVEERPLVKFKSFFVFSAFCFGISKALAALPPDWQTITYVDCVSPKDKISRLRVVGHSQPPKGEATIISVISDSILVTQDLVRTHRIGPNEEVYAGANLMLILTKHPAQNTIQASLTSRTGPLPASDFLCRLLR